MQDEMLNSGRYPRLCARTNPLNPDHHLWNNNGTWFVCYTVMDSPITAKRIRSSLRTRQLSTARIRRDRFLAKIVKISATQLQQGGNQ